MDTQCEVQINGFQKPVGTKFSNSLTLTIYDHRP